MTCEKHGEITESQGEELLAMTSLMQLTQNFVYTLTMGVLSVELMVQGGGSCLGVGWRGSTLDVWPFVWFCPGWERVLSSLGSAR